MGRPLRAAAGGVVYHVLNRANARGPMFEKPGDFEAFERVIGEACSRVDVQILAYCLMPNHWHLVLLPRHDGELTRFVTWLTLTHAQRWHANRESVGSGHLYQGRYKSFPVQQDDHFLTVCRYVERNALRAGLVTRAEEWRWSSLWHRMRRYTPAMDWLGQWPVGTPADWIDWVNEPQTALELEALRSCVRRGQPYGSHYWIRLTAKAMGLNTTLRPRGRPWRARCPIKGS
jgi:putative transposase